MTGFCDIQIIFFLLFIRIFCVTVSVVILRGGGEKKTTSPSLSDFPS